MNKDSAGKSSVTVEQEPHQLALRIKPIDGANFENFYVSADNALAVSALNTCLQSQVDKAESAQADFIWLHGGESVGKSHLLQALYRKACDLNVLAAYLPLAELVEKSPAALFEDLSGHQLLCIDDIDAVIGQDEWEKALFNLYNSAILGNFSIILCGRVPVSALNVKLPDLHSRLMSFAQFALRPLSDEDLLEALQLRAKGIGLVLPSELAEYIVYRSQRDIRSLMGVLKILDSQSLASQRRLTKPFVKEVMSW